MSRGFKNQKKELITSGEKHIKNQKKELITNEEKHIKNIVVVMVARIL